MFLASAIFGASASAASVEDFGEFSLDQTPTALSGAAVAFADETDSDAAADSVPVEVLGTQEATGVSPTAPTSEIDVEEIDEPSLLSEPVEQTRAEALSDIEAQLLAVREAGAEVERQRAEAEAERALLPPIGQAMMLADDLGVAATEAQAQAAWDQGYALAGGSNLSSFHNTILPCESGSQANRDSVVGRTDDWGRAQINRPVWKSTFESMTGLTFEDNIIRPVLNGYMAGYIENVQGLRRLDLLAQPLKSGGR